MLKHKKRFIRFILKALAWEALGEFLWACLRYLDNRRKNKPLSSPWDYWWAMIVYGIINGTVPLSDIEREWREGTPYEYKGKRRLDLDLVGVDLMDPDNDWTIVGARNKTNRKVEE